jgi:CheY-like chemotaxis protein
VVIAEDSVLLLAGPTKLLDGAGFEVCATAGDADELLAAVEREGPDVVIADVRMPPAHTDEGIRAALVIRRQWPDVAILVLSQYVEERYAADRPRDPGRLIAGASPVCSVPGSGAGPGLARARSAACPVTLSCHWALFVTAVRTNRCSNRYVTIARLCSLTALFALG